MERFSKATPRERRSYLLQRYESLKNIRGYYEPVWKELVKYMAPFYGCFSPDEKIGQRTMRYIFDHHAGHCIDTLVGGLSSYATSPALPWFRLVANDDSFKYDHEAQKWLGAVQSIIFDVLRKSNTYNSLHELYANLCIFGTAASIVVEDPVNVIHHHVLPVGSFCIQNNEKGEVDTLYREFILTAAQAVKEFGINQVSRAIRESYYRGNLENEFRFIHAIEPRADRNPASASNLDMPYASYYIELGNDEDKILRESGYPYFPCICPRWQVSGLEPYGISPAFNALPDVKQLQHVTYRKAELFDNLVEPPLQVPFNARQTPISLNSKAINYVASTASDQAIKPILQSTGNIDVVSNEVDKLHMRIEKAFFYDMFLMLQNFATTRKTAAEVYGLKEEKMTILGPVVERLQQECQAPLINIPYTILQRAGALPEPPASIGGKSFDIEFEGLLAQSQKSVDINPINQFIATIQSLSASLPDVVDRIDPDGTVDILSNRFAIDAHLLRSKSDADAIRQQRAQIQQQQQELAAGESIGNTVNAMAQAQKAGADASKATQSLDPLSALVGSL